MLHSRGNHPKPSERHGLAVVELSNLDFEVDPSRQTHEHLQVCPRAQRAVEAHRLRAVVESEGPQVAWKTRYMVEMRMGNEDPAAREAGGAPLELALRPFP